MNNRFLAIPCLFLLLCSAALAVDDPRVATPDTFIVNELSFENETIFQVLSRLNQLSTFNFSIENILPETQKSPPVEHPKLSGRFNNIPLRSALDQICAKDGRFAWTSDGNMINIFPRHSEDSKYFFDFVIPAYSVVNERDGAMALYGGLKKLGPARQQLAFLQIGNSRKFSEPWTESLGNVTVRHLLNRIADRLSPRMGWQVAGTKEFRYIVFHSSLRARVENKDHAAIPGAP